MKWIKEVYQLPPDHTWTAAPGHKILVLGRGAVVMEYPHGWFVELEPEQINLRDASTAAEASCVLSVSCLRLAPIDWSRLPLDRLLTSVLEGDDRDRIAAAPIVESHHAELEQVWTELRVVDPGEHREARSRICLSRGNHIQCLVTFDFWPEDAGRHTPVYDHALRSLRLGVPVDDPRRGRRLA